MAEGYPQTKIAVPRVSFEDQGNDARQSRVFIGAPDFRVFIWGIEISTDVFSVSVNHTLDDSVGTALVNIVNDNEKWILPTGFSSSNIDAIPDELSDVMLGTREGSALGLSLGTNTKDPTDRYVTPVKFAKLKRQNFEFKLQADIADPHVTTHLGGGENSLAASLLKTVQSSNLFPFVPGAPLIQMADPVRIFLKNPWKMDTGEDEWYFAFSGYVAAATEDFDASTNRSIIRCTCEDIRRLLRYMRTSTNPNVFDINVLQRDQNPREGRGEAALEKALQGTAADISLVTGNNALSSGQTIARRSSDDPPGVLELLLQGDSSGLVASAGGNSGDRAPFISGVLGFPDSQEKLIILTVDNNFEGNLTKQALNDIYPILTEQQVAEYGRDWSLGAVDGVRPDGEEGKNRLWIIMPDKAHLPNFRHPQDWGMRIDFFSEFRSRLDIINEFVKNMDCIWYATPKGDIVFEFPNYDCQPQLHDDPWRSILTLQNEFTRFSVTEDDRNIKTLTIGIGSATEDYDLSKSDPYLAVFPFFNPELIARYGVREQRQNRPFFYNEKVIPGALKSLTMMWQEQANADAYRLEGLEMLPNFRAPIGRPYLFKFRNTIGFCDAIQHQVTWGQMAQTVYSFKYLRHFDAVQGDWQKISGNYGWRWKPQKSGGALVDNVTAGLDPIIGKKDPLVGGGTVLLDPTAADMEQTHQEILFQETTGAGPILTEDDHVRLDSIVRQMGDTEHPPTPSDRRALIGEYNSIISKVGTR